MNMQVMRAEWGGCGLCFCDVPRVTNVMKECRDGKRKQATENGVTTNPRDYYELPFHEQNHKILLRRGSRTLLPVTQLRDTVRPLAHKALVQ
jgi:hypothetical protein